MTPIQFWRGRHLYQIAPARTGDGFIGLCNGRTVATAKDGAAVMRALIMSTRWRKGLPEGGTP
ncbi:hypothetical protein IWC96_08570 [Brevundimonas sp. BAL450]|uniref:hypothetical protein n=1 Tax=Brevundimonas sp. BAL450 TaxID=1708162 RepID=UPI0018CB22B3|nr:hypothetical protein [Brevundimonas sp. BAL450]MBG7615335.1 hypothetical protein [Brevundimonas sp. BAL450]